MTKGKLDVSPARRAAVAVLAGVALAAAVSWGQPGQVEPGLHIPGGRPVSFYHNLTDGSGFLWDFDSFGSVREGTNYCYGSGMKLMISDTVFRAGSAWSDADGDEFEMGPASTASLTIHRRVRVYRDRPLARFLDIFTNAGVAEVTVQIMYQTGTPYGMGNIETSSGNAQWGADDTWFVTSVAQPSIPSLLHIPCDARSQVRPDVFINPGQIAMSYRLTVPAGQTVILCHFESQNNSQAAHERTIKAFNLRELLSDLPGLVRGRIVNFRAGTGAGGVYLDRNDQADTVTLDSGDVIYGTITNERFVIETFFETMTIPAERIVGMEADADEQQTFRMVLTDGQVVCGNVVDGNLDVTLSTGGQLEVPLSRASQWSYRLDEKRPALDHFDKAAVALRTGDLLIIDAEEMKLPFRTAHGVVDLSSEDLLELRLAGAAGAGHRATLLNGTRLAGLLEPSELTLSLTLGKTVTLRREMIQTLRLANISKPDDSLTRITLANGDVLLGSLTDERIPFDSDFGVGDLTAADVRSIELSGSHLGRAKVLLWDKTVLRGEMTATHVDFQIVPGPKLRISIGLIASIVRAQATPRAELLEAVKELVVRLGAESYTDRESASEELRELGATIIPMLRDYLDTDDAEVRRRLQEIIDYLAKQMPRSGRPSGSGGMPPWGMFR